jgi:Mg2+ and Co2+ transporter CorA
MVDIRAVLYDSEGVDRELSPAEIDLEELDESGLLWLDVSDANAARLQEILELSADTAAELRAASATPEVAFHPTYVHVTVVAAAQTMLGYRPVPLHCLAGRNWVATVHNGPLGFLERFRDSINGDSGLGRLDAVGLLSVFLNEHIASYVREMEPLELELERIDLTVLNGKASGDDVIRQLVAVRRQLAQLRRLLAPHRELYARLALPDFALLADSEAPEALATLPERAENALAVLDTTREMTVNSFDVYTTWTAHETNKVMRLLTVASVTLLPPTLLASVMGMNSLPHALATMSAFELTLAGMAAAGAGVLGLARWRAWI